ncbi:MAG TPA: Ig-like domain-containing protein, partial [Verrucomicrobiae bacterium]|nr:Ig-like domain-containing protein [Verrucomicrobiae bacterium]
RMYVLLIGFFSYKTLRNPYDQLHRRSQLNPHPLVRLASTLALLGIIAVGGGSSAVAQPYSFGGNAQHTGLYSAPAQRLQTVRWTTTIDLDNSGAAAHYGAPLITAGNTVLVPVKTTNGFQVRAFEGATGRLKYTLDTDYMLPTLPTNAWLLVYQPVIAMPPSGPRLYYAGAGGTVYYIDNLDSDTPGVPVQQCFFTNLATYASNKTAFDTTVFINTPLTAGSNGVVFFGFRGSTNAAPVPLSTTNSGFARMDPSGNSTYVLAGDAAGDDAITRDSHNCAPALSHDAGTLYVAVKGSTANHSYLLGLDSTTLATKYRTRLLDPRNGNYADVPDNSTASPMIGPDGDVYFGVFANPNNGSRGFLLHFSADLAVQKTPGGFGWDYTAAIVPTNMVPGYTGTSAYLVFGKYNNYAENGDGNGINRIALLDPNANQIDPHPTAGGLVEMREVLTVIGCTPDPEHHGATYPFAVREWCINTAAVNPATRSVFAPCEDGRIYRWDLAANSLAEAFTLGPGVGQPYVPTAIGPDGGIYTLNGGKFFALGGFTNLGIAICSSAPDLCSVVAGKSVTFMAMVTNLNTSGPAPTGTVTFLDRTYRGLTGITNPLAADVPLTNGVASVTSSTLSAGGSYPTNYSDSHFITATYSGDVIFPIASATLVQKMHASATTTTINSAAGSNNAVIFMAAVAPSLTGLGLPSGMVSFWDGAAFLGQVPLDTNGLAALTTTNLGSGSHSLAASYSSDTVFASSSATIIGAPPYLTGFSILSNGAFRIAYSNVIGAPFTVLGSWDLSLPLSNWPLLGPAIETQPGQFQFTDLQGAGQTQRFYRVRSP